MKYIYLLLSLFIIQNISAQNIKIEGEISGIDRAEISVLVLPCKLGEIPIMEKTQCESGKFQKEITLNKDMWHLVRLRSPGFNSVFGAKKSSKEKLKNRDISFFVKPHDNILIKAKVGDYGINYQVLGNEINIQRNHFAEKLFPLEEELNKLTILHENAKNRDIEDSLSSIRSKLEKQCLELIIEHPTWIYSAEMLAAFPEDTIAKYFKLFSPEVQNSFFGIHLSTILNAAEIGSSAPNFSLLDEKDKNVLLSDFKGKYVVLEFWGSWCGYCTKGIPRMKEYYSKYHDHVEFIGIACRDNKETWLKTIKKYNLNWINLFAENEKITDDYGVEGYPTKVVIDKNGEIAFKSTGESDEFYKKIDEILSNDNN